MPDPGTAEPGRTAPRPAPGWFPDPLGPPGQMRWWDGQAWSAGVQAPAAPAPPAPRVAAAPAPRRKRPRRVIAWGAIGGFALAAVGIVIAVNRGQDVCEVSATGIKFCEREVVAQEQPELVQQASSFEEQALESNGSQTVPGVADIGGIWTGDGGYEYVIEQFGDQAVISEVDPGGLTTAVGFGTVAGSVATFDYEGFDGSVGVATLRLDGNTLTGSFENLTFGTTINAVLRR